MPRVFAISSILLAVVPSCFEAEVDAPSFAHLRVAHLSPDAPPVDLCIAPAGSGDFAGPVLKEAGAAAGISYGSVTKYLEVQAQRYDVRLVAAGATDCATSVGGLPDFTDLPELSAGAVVSVGAIGHVNRGAGATAFRLAPYIDDSTVAFGRARLRFIHASPGTPNVDIGLRGGALFQPVFTDVGFGSALATETAPLAHTEISARATGSSTDVIAIKTADLPAGAIATAFAIGELNNPSAPLNVLLCVDNAAAGDSLLASCKTVGSAPERAKIRVGHWSPDAPPVDVCLAEAGTAAYGPRLLRSLGAPDGLRYPQLTQYVEVPKQAYDARIVLATADDCSTGAVPDTLGIDLSTTTAATIAAIGALDPSGAAAANPGFSLKVLADEISADANRAKVRFFHASPGTPAVDVGLGTGHGFVKVFSHVSFGTTAAASNSISAAGYVTANPGTAPVTARLAGSSADALTVPNVTLAARSIATAVAIGGKTGSNTNPLRVLLCGDNAPATGLLTSCVVAP